MCDCRKKLEIKLNDRLIDQKPESKNHQSKLTGYTLILGDELQEKGFMEAIFTSEDPLKKGGFRVKKIKQNILFSYCPFCGEKYQCQ